MSLSETNTNTQVYGFIKMWRNDITQLWIFSLS